MGAANVSEPSSFAFLDDVSDALNALEQVSGATDVEKDVHAARVKRAQLACAEAKAETEGLAKSLLASKAEVAGMKLKVAYLCRTVAEGSVDQTHATSASSRSLLPESSLS